MYVISEIIDFRSPAKHVTDVESIEAAKAYLAERFKHVIVFMPDPKYDAADATVATSITDIFGYRQFSIERKV